MRRALSFAVTVAVGAAVLVLPASAALAIEPPTVRVTPGVSSVLVGETRQLAATVKNLTDPTVTWSLRSGGGSVSATGLYSPPAQAPASPVAVVRATSVEDPAVFGEASVAVASGVPGGAFGPEVVAGLGGGQDADMGDVTGDGVPDVVLLQNLANGLRVWDVVVGSWNGTGITRTTAPRSNLLDATNDYVLDLELGDVDGDSDLDVVALFGSASSQAFRYQVYRNSGTGTFTLDAKAPTVGGARTGAKGRLVDWDGDGHLDLVRLEWFGNLLWERGAGNGTFAQPVLLMSTADADTFDIGDLTGDGRPELVVGIKGTSNSSTTIEVGVNNGFGGIASETSYNVGMAPEPRIADTNGDGWNDVVVGVGGEHYTFFPPRLLTLPNLATGTGTLGAAVELLAWRPFNLEAVHADGDGVLDLAGHTFRGPVMLRRTGPNAYAPTHAAARTSLHHSTWGDVTGDGRLDAFVNFDDSSQLWPGSADATPSFAVDPTVSRVNATTTAAFSATLRNSPVEPKVTWSASRGTFSGATYTAPATASPSGSTVTITAAVTGSTATATRTITVVNDRFQFTSLGGQQVRHVAYDPQQPAHVYAATATGVYRSVTNGVTFSLLGTTGTTGTDARQVAVVRDPGGGASRVLAVFGSTLYRLADGGDWQHAGAPASVASVSAAPDAPVAWLAAGGQVVRSADGGASWTALGQTSVTEVDAIDATRVWVVRGAAPRVSRAELTTDPSPALAMTARELPAPAAVVSALAVHPTDRTLAYVATTDVLNPLFRDAGGDGSAGSPAWAAVPTPDLVDRLSVSPSGVVLAGRAATLGLYKSTDAGAAWHSVARGFTSVTAQTVAHRADGLDLVGTSSGLYTPVEQVPPAPPVVTGGPTGTTGPGGANAFTFTFDPVADAASYLCALDDAGWSSCSASKTYSGPLASGTHTFSVVAVDANGNESAPATRTWTVDATPAPVPSILTGPAGLVRSTTATFTFELTGDATGATCALDAAAPAACSPGGVTYSSLSQGSHTFSVRSLDAAGNASAAATRTWTVDTVPPAFPSFWATPQWVSPSTSAFFQWQSDNAATYACTLDGAPVACSASTASLTGLAEGVHTFVVTASDAAGNAASNLHQWTVDLTDPGAPVITVKPDVTTGSPDAYFEFASPSNDVAYYLCSRDGSGPSSCYGDAAYSNLGVGTHTFSVRAVDHAGRQSAVTTYEWTVAMASPVLTGGPSGLVASRTATFTWTTLDGATSTCTLDGGLPLSCASGVTYTNLPDGPHTFSVTATKNGATSAPATREWTVDATAPAAPVLTVVPPSRTASASASFAWGADPLATYSCTLDDAPVACEAGSYEASVEEGAHTFAVTARDAALNASTSTYSWTVDRTGPIVSLSAKPAARTASRSASFEFGSAATDLDRYACTVDGAAAACASPLNLSSLADGEHTVTVVAYDTLDNASAPVSWTWTVDATGPAVTLTSKPATLTKATTAAFAFASAAPDAQEFACTLDGVTQACAGTVDYSSLAAGTHTFSVVGIDDLGNVGAPATHTWKVDPVAPVAAIATPSAVLNPSHTVTFNEPVSRVSTSTVRLLVTGTTSVVPAAVSCRTAANSVVACTATAVQRAVLTPSVPLTPGQLYTISAAGLTDLAGNPAAAVSRGYRASTSEQETSLAAKQGWRRLPWTGAQGGSFHVARVRNATASYTFTGTAVTWYGVRGPTYGLADVYVDNVLKASKVNFYSTSTGALTRTISGLTNAKHTLRIVVRGERGSTSGRGTDVAVDAFKVGTSLAATPAVTWTWARNPSSATSGGAHMAEDYAGATYTITFRGRAVDWVTTLGPNMGKATVHIDGVSKGTFDNWASANKFQHVRRFSGLTDRVHTLTITVLGQRRTGATGTYVSVDRFGILP